MVIAELRNVTKRFGPVTALAGIDLEIARGQLLALLGPNGAGKTTAVRLLLGLSRPDSGAARVFGRDPQERDARKRVGAMLQAARVPDALRVCEHIELFSSYYPNPLPFDVVVKAAGLEGIERRLFGRLSGGQKQRVLFAIAICGNPDILVLDEPTAGLDVDSRRALWRHIRSFLARGGSVLLTTHYLEEADALADRIVVLNQGRVAADGTSSEIRQRAASRKIRCITSLNDTQIVAMAERVSVRRDGVFTEIVAADSDRVVRRLFAEDPEMRDLEVTGAGLEDAFLAITEAK
ncbi:MAG TPA: ABC transporter ATP-binding protein [Bryobacteraceae bacterium]|nr:ABC transporter ATP-binding protein [Bryobacteraceae bacterium]